MADAERSFTDAELDRAVEALSEPERFRAAEARVVRVAPQLQQVLDRALSAGGWVGEAQEQQLRQAAGHDDPAERIAAMRSLLGEEARIGMLVGVAVGWELARELELDADDDRGQAREESG
ncbi:MAG: hypothetical protein WD399_07770 [Thermoleophilaceae bacterium]